jgi:glycosidase
MSLGLLSMTRGIPCVFYGTEALMAKTGSHGDIREDMPDFIGEYVHDIFDSSTRLAHEKEMISWISSLNTLRTQSHSAFFTGGKRFQMVPTEGIYAAGIKGNTSVLLYAANQSDTLQELDMSTLAELNLDLLKARLLVQSGSGNAREIERTGNYWKLGARDFYVWEIPVMEVLLKETSPR